jgi:hypothetical protein
MLHQKLFSVSIFWICINNIEARILIIYGIGYLAQQVNLRANKRTEVYLFSGVTRIPEKDWNFNNIGSNTGSIGS